MTSLFLHYASRIDSAIEAAETEGYDLRDRVTGRLDRQKVADNFDLMSWAFDLGQHPNRRHQIERRIWDEVERAYLDSLAIENSLEHEIIGQHGTRRP